MDRLLFDKSKARINLFIEQNNPEILIVKEARHLLACYQEDGSGYGAQAAIEAWEMDLDPELAAVEEPKLPPDIAAMPLDAVRREIAHSQGCIDRSDKDSLLLLLTRHDLLIRRLSQIFDRCELCLLGWPLNGQGNHAVEEIKNRPYKVLACKAGGIQ